MALQEDFERLGNTFFQWRSYLPLFMAVLFFLALLSHRPSFADKRLDTLWDLGCLMLSFLGLGIRFFTVGFVPRGTSGRNTRGQVADCLNTTGMYSLVRNPIYLGNFIIWLGLSICLQSWWFTTIIILFFTLFYERIIFAEESFLREKFGPAFEAWAAATPTIIPRMANWQPPDLPFSWKSAIGREYATFYAIIVSFTVVEVLKNLFAGNVTLDKTWIFIFLLGSGIYVLVRLLKKKTRVLAVSGR